jgi:hypothetical protein
MGKTLSIDLRTRVVAAVSEGMSHRGAAERFGVSAASAVHWVEAANPTGSVEAKPEGGDARSHRIDEDGPPPRPRSQGRTLPRRRVAWTLEDDDLHGDATSVGHDRAHGARRADEPRCLPGLHRTGAGAHATAATRSLWTICLPTKAPTCVGLSKRLGRSCVICRPTRPTSTQSRTPSPNSRRSCGKLPRGPSKIYGT